MVDTGCHQPRNLSNSLASYQQDQPQLHCDPTNHMAHPQFAPPSVSLSLWSNGLPIMPVTGTSLIDWLFVYLFNYYAKTANTDGMQHARTHPSIHTSHTHRLTTIFHVNLGYSHRVFLGWLLSPVPSTSIVI